MPWSAAQFIESAQDRSSGGGFAQDMGTLKPNLTKTAVFKFIIKAGGDNGQYLEAPNKAYLMDTQLMPTAKTNPEATSAELLQEIFSPRGTRPFGVDITTAQTQIQGINEGLANKVFTLAEQLDLTTLQSLLSNYQTIDPERKALFAQELINRTRQSRLILKFLANNPKLTLEALNPYDQSKYATYTDQATSDSAKKALLTLFEEQGKQ